MTPRCKFVHNLPCEKVSERITELEAENAEMRKLATALYAWLLRDNTEPMALDEFEELEAMANVLGIEVSDG